MKISNQDLRLNARNKLSGNYGQGILAAIVPAIIGAIAGSITNSIFAHNIILMQISTILIGAVTSYMTIKMILRLAKNNHFAQFSESLTPGNRLGKFILYTIIISAIGFAIQTPINLLAFNTWLPDSTIINETIESMASSNPTAMFNFVFQYLFFVMLAAILIFIILIRLQFTSYILVDEESTILDAVKKSILLTKGNVFRIIFMDLFFIGWYLLSIITCGILLFYVLPYHLVSQMNLFLTIKEEKGFPTIYPEEKTKPLPTTEWMDENKEETKTSNDWDF